MKYIIKNKETGKEHGWSLATILREINRDRSAEWSPYNKTDWKEGLEEFTEFTFVRNA